MQELVSILPLVGIALLFWLLLIRPAQKRQREMAKMQSEITVGAQVVLSSGLFGTIRAVTDGRFGLEIAPGVVIEVAKGAVAGIVPPETTLVDAVPAEDKVGTLDRSDHDRLEAERDGLDDADLRAETDREAEFDAGFEPERGNRPDAIEDVEQTEQVEIDPNDPPRER